MRYDSRALGYRVRCARLSHGLTQEQLAELIDISAPFVGHLERGTRTPSLETIIALCYTLDISPNDLLIDSLPESRFERRPSVSGATTRLRNMLTDWLHPDWSEEPSPASLPADFSKLPPLEFGCLAEEDSDLGIPLFSDPVSF